ncbi:MAG: hypothetical protein JWO38_8249 [Gemmataceae bacterium]|nr:hypothetical protein [Gemmataceae bacterium]
MSFHSWLRNLRSTYGLGSGGRTLRRIQRRKLAAGHRLTLESLEARVVPSTFTVLNTSDSGRRGASAGTILGFLVTPAEALRLAGCVAHRRPAHRATTPPTGVPMSLFATVLGKLIPPAARSRRLAVPAHPGPARLPLHLGKTVRAAAKVRLSVDALEARDTPAGGGVLDPTFGAGGLVMTQSTPGTFAHAVAIDPQGRSVVVGETFGAPGQGIDDFLIIRLNPNGTPDTSFGTGGRQVLDLGPGSRAIAHGVAIDPSGNITVVGTATIGGVTQAEVARLDPAGQFEPGFGNNGQETLPSPTTTTSLSAVALDANGNIVVVGSGGNPGSTDFFIVGRLIAATGMADPTFNGGVGSLRNFHVGGTNSDVANGVAIDAAGNIVVAGSSQNTVSLRNMTGVARLLGATGNFDPTFGTGGSTTFNLPGSTDDLAEAVAIDPAGRVVLAGSFNPSATQTRIALARLAAGTGALDPTFGVDGAFTTANFGGTNEFANDVAVRPDGRIVAAGATNTGPGGEDFAVLQLSPNGALDPSFNPAGPTPGQSSGDFGVGAADQANALALQPDGRIVVAGYNNSTGGFEVARLTGTPGPGLAVGGTPGGRAAVYVPAGGAFGTTQTAVLQPFGNLGTDVRVAVGDVNGDGFPDTILVTGPGVPIRVAVVSGADNTTLLVAPFDPFGGNFTGGGFVAAGDFEHTGRAEFVVTPDQGGGPRVGIFALGAGGTVTTRANFFGIDDPNFRGGARAAVGDVNGDGTPDLIVAAGFGGGPRVALFDGRTVIGGTPTRLVGDFFAFPGTDATTLRNGVFVAAGDVNGDGKTDLIFGGGPGGAPRVFILSGALVAAGNIGGAQASPIANFFVAGNTADRGGVRVATTELDGDKRTDVVAGSGSGSPNRVTVYLGKSFTAAADEPAPFEQLSPFGSGTPLADGVYVG